MPEEVTLNEPEKPPSKKSKPAPKPESEQIETEPEVSLEMDKENYFQTPKKSEYLFYILLFTNYIFKNGQRNRK